jgi:hypothetical protein
MQVMDGWFHRFKVPAKLQNIKVIGEVAGAKHQPQSSIRFWQNHQK